MWSNTPLSPAVRYFLMAAGLTGLVGGATFVFLGVDSLTNKWVVGSQEMGPLSFLFGFGSLVIVFSAYFLNLIRHSP